jgi:Mg2+ and Co2+ transporter CorA
MDIRLIATTGVEERGVEDLPMLLQGEEGLIWVDIPTWDDEAVHVLSNVFRFHPLAVKDARERNRVPKMHAYHDHVFVILHAPERGKHGHVHYIELDQFVGVRYLVTVHGPINPAVDPDVALRETRAVLERIQAGRLRPVTPSQLSHAIVTVLTREQEDFIETLTKDVWQLEQRLTGGNVGNPEEYLDELFPARHGLLAVRTMGGQSGAIYHSMTSLTGISPDSRLLVADNAQQFDRVRSLADGEMEYLHGVIEFYQTVLSVKSTLLGQAQNEKVQRLTEASYAQNEEVKKISAWAAIFFTPTLIGTVYGMNFDHMPELHWVIGYPLALLAMVLLSVGLYVMFKRRKWL